MRSARTTRRRCTGSCASKIARPRASCSTRAPTRTCRIVTASCRCISRSRTAIWRRSICCSPRAPTRARGTPPARRPLVLAARAGDAAIAERLLARGAPVDERDPEYDQTALMVAVTRRACRRRAAAARARRGRERADARRRGARVSLAERERGLERRRHHSWRLAGARHASAHAGREDAAALRDAARRSRRDAAARRSRRRRSSRRMPTASRRCLNAILNASIAAARGAPSGTQHLAVARYLLERGANVERRGLVRRRRRFGRPSTSATST